MRILQCGFQTLLDMYTRPRLVATQNSGSELSQASLTRGVRLVIGVSWLDSGLSG